MSKLVIVESPAKAKTIRKYLGNGYEVTASMGHIRDLPKSQLGIDVEHGYAPQYINIKGKEKIIKELKTMAKNSDEVFLATDPDREGEAISWHLANLLGLDTQAPQRVTFGEITKKGVTQGMAAPRAIDMDLFNAQQARRILDRLVGYKLSPFLWRKVRRGLSAGRVQSVAVRLIVDREKEIEAFQPEEYWNIDAVLCPPSSTKKFTARLFSTAAGKKLEVKNAEQSQAIVQALQGADYTVSSISRGKRKKTPAPPFITSTMQQEASRRLGFTATRTMRAAQMLYEGVDVAGQGTMGLITYMRTDSLRIADEAVAAAKDFITGSYGEQYVCPYKRTYKSRSATAAQDAHEAVRPTNPALTPDEVEKSVTGDAAKLYRLIWSRFIASQMSDCQQDTVSADIVAADYLFRASGYVVTFDGFTALYEEATDEKEKKETALPPLTEGDVLKLKELKPEQKFTQPPARYTEATLIRALEENGIGRPSTYAPIITTIIDHDYVEREQKKLVPTKLGRVINDLMMEQFPDIIDVTFSANMEKNLDQIENGKADWHKTIDDFYQGFEKNLLRAEEEMKDKKVKVPDEETDEICELCGRKMVIKSGRYGKFLACPGFPECKNTKRLVKDTGGQCPKCGSRVLIRHSKKGRVYYGCEKNPTCDFMTWNEPTAEKCPQCGSTLFKKGGKNGVLLCEKEGCGYSRPAQEKKG
ncbi:type I DNA topoisomerase [Ruthenibacterium sp. CLA-JM-H11]|uniref:DNA topoisomerase 1 n=1 Tax=Ruthenibacterium intestinale TaxID=3133163 RepID=A0ABV1GFI6_9FIRM